MKRTVLMLTTVLAVGIAIGMLGNQVLLAQQAPVSRTVLQQTDLDGVAGKEIIMYRADVGPAAVAGKHHHPGPELLYVLEGSLIIEPDGQPPVTLKAGETSHIPARHVHNVRNGSTTGPAKVIVFMVGEKGQALTTPVK
jgi:quercetin dioxygenase-like cupin family protein